MKIFIVVSFETKKIVYLLKLSKNGKILHFTARPHKKIPKINTFSIRNFFFRKIKNIIFTLHNEGRFILSHNYVEKKNDIMTVITK